MDDLGKNRYFSIVPIACLALSQSYTDYMTSGLENPLSFFLMGACVYLVARSTLEERRIHVVIFLLLGLIFLNRFDYALLVLPLVIYLVHFKLGFKSSLRAAVPGIALILGWLAFSLVYFGSFLPNSFYAKLGTGYARAEILRRGIQYYEATLIGDPITLLLIVLGVVIGLRSKNGLYRSLAIGMLLYCVFVLVSGGDFMIGRFFAILAYTSVFITSSYILSLASSRILPVATVAILVFAATTGSSPLFGSSRYSNQQIRNGIADERGFYYQRYGLLAPERAWPNLGRYAWRRPEQYLVRCGGLGARGLSMSAYYLIDYCGLTDPLIARLPAIRDPNWRIGHHYRKVPIGYGRYLTEGVEIEDVDLRPLLRDLSLAMSGPLWRAERWHAIMRLNFLKPYKEPGSEYSDPNQALIGEQALSLD